MPDTTIPRGYPYPIYTDPAMDFPDAIQDLATAIDTDVGAAVTRLAAARQRPSVRMTSVAAQSVASNTSTLAGFTTGGVSYDNAGMANLAASRLEPTEQGVYFLAARVVFAAPGSGSPYNVRVSILSSAVITPIPVSITRLATPLQDVAISVATLFYHAGGGGDFITLNVEHTHPSARSMTSRHLVMSKISNITGGS